MQVDDLKTSSEIVSLRPDFEKASLPWERKLDDAIIQTLGMNPTYINEQAVAMVRSCLIRMLSEKLEASTPKKKIFKVLKAIFAPVLNLLK